MVNRTPVPHRLWLGLATSLAMVWTTGAGAQVPVEHRLVNVVTGSGQIGLGYPVPVAVDSTAPVAGFRSYASLNARLEDLALRSPDLRVETIGTTLKGRPIRAYVLGDGDGLAASGSAAPGMLVNATIHAREWQAPEVAAGIIERFMEDADDSGLARFLLDEMRTVVIPVLNVDGFLMTQNNPDRVWLGADPGWDMTPREGRMRRKNLRGADEDFASTADHLQGVDLNRNFDQFFGANASSSPDSRSLVYRGPAPRSEPEAQALANAVTLIGGPRLRLFEDIHSFGQVMNTVFRGHAESDAETNTVADRFGRVQQRVALAGFPASGRFYSQAPNPAGTGIGTTSEYFAYTYQIPTWTLELEPGGPLGSREYGGSGWHHDGFVLPESQVPRLRAAMAEGHLLLAYHTAGPAIVQAVRITDRDNGNLTASSEWRADGPTRRVREFRVHAPLRSGGRYQVWVAFDRPLRYPDANGNPVRFPDGTAYADPPPQLRLDNGAAAIELQNGRFLLAPTTVPGGTWNRYRGDAWLAEADLPAFGGPAPGFRLELVFRDAMGRTVDTRPQTVADWRGGVWVDYEGRPNGLDDQQQFAAIGAPVWLGAGSATRVGEGEDFAVQLERAEGAAVTVQLAYGAGVSGPASVTLNSTSTRVPLRLADNAEVADAVQSSFVRISGGGISGSVEQRLTVVDNDRAELRFWQVADRDDLVRALSAAVPGTATLTVGLPAGATLDLTATLPAIRGRVVIEGQQALLRPVANAAVRLFEVESSGELSLADLRLSGGAGLEADGGQVRNAGTLNLARVESSGASGRCGGAVFSSGTLRVERSTFSGARAQSGGVFCVQGGSATITTSTVIDARADTGAVLLNRGATTLSALSLDANAVADGGALLDSPAGTVQLAGSVLSAGNGASCAGSVVSAGDNLLHPGRCNGQAADFLSSEPLLSAATTDALVRELRSGAWNERQPAQCSGLDQAGLPRPQQGRCEPGARESGSIVPVAGLWWTPSRSGQGVDLKRAGDGLLALVYTYDDNGRPLTYTAQGAYTSAIWRGELRRWRQAPVSLLPESTVVGELELRFSDARHAQFRLALTDGPTASYDLEAFAFGDESQPARIVERTYSGASRYGMTYARHGDTPFALLYAYDADQVLRWVSGEQTAEPGTLKLRSFTGACPSCTYTAPVASDAGQLRLRGAGLGAATADFELRFGNGAGGSLLRDGATLERLDSP